MRVGVFSKFTWISEESIYYLFLSQKKKKKKPYLFTYYIV